MFFFKRKEDNKPEQETEYVESATTEKVEGPVIPIVQGICEVICPVCGGEILPASSYCGCCGVDLSTYSSLPPAETLVDPDSTINICQSCGTVVPTKYRYCHKCGKNIYQKEIKNMLYDDTTLIEEAFKAHDLKYSVQETPLFSYLEAGFNGKNISGMKIRFISVGENSEVKATTEDIAKYPEDRKEKGYREINRLNEKYKYAKFVLAENGGVHAEYDFPRSAPKDGLGEMAVEIAFRFVNIIDDAYPDLMKSIWA